MDMLLAVIAGCMAALLAAVGAEVTSRYFGRRTREPLRQEQIQRAIKAAQQYLELHHISDKDQIPELHFVIPKDQVRELTKEQLDREFALKSASPEMKYLITHLEKERDELKETLGKVLEATKEHPIRTFFVTLAWTAVGVIAGALVGHFIH